MRGRDAVRMILDDEFPSKRARSRSPAGVSSAGSDVMDMSPISPSTAEHDTRELLRSLEGERIYPDLPPHSPEQSTILEQPPSPPCEAPVALPAPPVEPPVPQAPVPNTERKRPAEESCEGKEEEKEESPAKRAKVQEAEESDASSSSSSSSSDSSSDEEEERRRKRRRRRKRKQARKEKRRQNTEMTKTMVALMTHLLQAGQGPLVPPLPQWAPAWPVGTGPGQIAPAPHSAMPPPQPPVSFPFHPPLHFQ